MATKARQVSLQEANAQYRMEDAARLQSNNEDEAIESARGKPAGKPRKGAPARSRKKAQS